MLLFLCHRLLGSLIPRQSCQPQRYPTCAQVKRVPEGTLFPAFASSLSDGPNMIPLAQMDELIGSLMAFDRLARENPVTV